jgi:nitric oxide synthase oxygenase domain/subunit
MDKPTQKAHADLLVETEIDQFQLTQQAEYQVFEAIAQAIKLLDTGNRERARDIAKTERSIADLRAIKFLEMPASE